MNDAHLELLKAYATTRDAEAFASIVDAYRDLVYSVCLRVLGSPADAEDATQACFVMLARRAGEVRSSVAGWLHARATALSLTHLKRERNRRVREREYASHRPEESAEPNWEQIAPEVDQALLELPEDLREILVARFLQRKDQVSIAEETGLSAPTVCRRIRAGLEALRSKLAARGVVGSVVVFEVALQGHALSHAPETLAASLGKLAMAGVGKAGAAAGARSGFLATLGSKLVTATLAGITVVAAITAIIVTTNHKDSSMRTNVQSSGLLRNLRPMVNWNLGQNYQINGYLQFQMECLGESPDYDYWFFAGVGGDNHTQVFTADTSRFCHSLSHIDFGPEFAKTLYDAVGYDFTYVTEEQFNADRPRYIGELVKCIDQGIPVIAKETGSSTRTKVQEFSLLVGYEDSGGELLFVEGDRTKPFKVPTNQHVSFLFVIPGAKKQALPLAEVYRKAVLNIPALLTRPQKGDVSFGRHAFNAWAERLLTEDYAGWTDEQLDACAEGNLPLWPLHTTYVCIVATNGSDRHFLNRAIKICPDLPFIADVEREYAEMGRLWKEEMDATGGSFNISKQTLRDPQARRRISDFIRRYTACCDRIIEIYRANGYPRGAGVGLLEREPDILIVEMPPCRMVTSGLLADDKELKRFNAMWGRLGSRIADKINPRDFMYHDEEHKRSVWLFMLEDWITEADTEGYNIVTFDGGLFAAAIADGWEHKEYDRVYRGIKAWLAKQDNLELDESSDRHILYHFAGPHSAQMKEWDYGKVRYFVPIRILGRGDKQLLKASIQTERLVMRRFTPDDWKELQQLAIDKKNTGGDRYDHAWPTDDKGAQEMAQWCVGQRCFAACLKDSGKLIGFVRFNSIDDQGQLDLGHMFHSRYRGERYASEAIRPLLAVAFADPKVKAIVARNAVEWPGQLMPLVELGFRELERGQAPNFNGAEGGPIGFVACLMGLTRTEWETGNR